jgi:hypothetical protein
MKQQNLQQNNNAVPANNAANTESNNTEKNEISKPIVWLDKQDVRQKLHISSRTLQNWRSKGLLPYYEVEGKIYYKEEDVDQMIIKRRKEKGTRNKKQGTENKGTVNSEK